MSSRRSMLSNTDLCNGYVRGLCEKWPFVFYSVGTLNKSARSKTVWGGWIGDEDLFLYLSDVYPGIVLCYYH